MELDLTYIAKVLSGIFDITNVLTAILFAVYCFVIVSSNPFIDKIRHTKSFINSREYIKNTVHIGIFAILISKSVELLPVSDFLYAAAFILLVPLTVWWLVRFVGCMKRFSIMSSI